MHDAVRHRADRQGFRNEVTPRNFIFRCASSSRWRSSGSAHPSEAGKWFEFWTRPRVEWWQTLGVQADNLTLREHDARRARALRQGAAPAPYDIEYRYPVHRPRLRRARGHRPPRRLRPRAAPGSSSKTEAGVLRPGDARALPAARDRAGGGLTRGVLVLLCEAYTSTRAGRRPRVPAVPAAARADQGGNLPAGGQGRHAGDRARSSTSTAPPARRAVRRQAVDRQALRAHGRGGHAVLLHHRRPDRRGSDRHGPRPRHRRPGPHRARSRAAATSPIAISCSAADVRRVPRQRLARAPGLPKRGIEGAAAPGWPSRQAKRQPARRSGVLSKSVVVIGSSGWRRRKEGKRFRFWDWIEAVYPCGEGDLVDPEELDGMGLERNAEPLLVNASVIARILEQEKCHGK